ncbi:hypothetical protein WS71_08635 [Burkholderia mayonis]|uniref:Uncharacterized protein n=1 Tax=Burkholderia mayonis TaxID=1385591 RepID=A0A1B4FUP2_9BURK|nr:hypothetical protein WS71_08635 [Burkholderia mayonis]KVE52545.1 hypothetical protein WS71_09490 [Burkholderia mayonis]
MPNRRREPIDRKAFRIDAAKCDERPFYRTFGAVLTLRTLIRHTSRESAQECRIDADNNARARDRSAVSISLAQSSEPPSSPFDDAIALAHANPAVILFRHA